MANRTNRIPFNEIPHEEAFHPVRGPLWLKVFEILNEIRTKTGGDSDYIFELQGGSTTTSADVTELTDRNIELESEIVALRASIKKLDKRLASFIAEIETNV